MAATGRLSSTDPNLQNIPIRTAEGRRIRQAFVAPKGYKLMAADYSQIELRIMAHLAKDEGLLDAFRHDLDVHKATAAEVFGVPLEQVTTDQRRSAKAINFGLIYGMSAFGLAKQIGVDRKRGAGLHRPLLRPLPGRAGLYGAHPRSRRPSRAMSRPCSAAACTCRTSTRRTRPAQGRRARGDQRADAGHGGGHHQARDDRRGSAGCGQSGLRCRKSSCRCTTNWCWRCVRI